MNYGECMEYMEYVQEKCGISMGLDNMERILSLAGRPEKAYKIIHIAGTNGKGSIGAFLAYILSEAGYRTGRYVSPALTDYREKIQFNFPGGHSYISCESISRYLTEIKEIIDSVNKKDGGKFLPSSFEMETLVSLLAFRDSMVDYAIVECGMGGMLDATNAVCHKEMCIFAPIDYDHMSYLGNTIEEIAGDKAGIINGKCMIVSAVQDDAVKKVLDSAAHEYGNRIVYACKPRECIYEEDKMEFNYKQETYTISLLGGFQADNASVAVEAAHLLLSEKDSGLSPDYKTKVIKNGLMRTRWKGRLEIISYEPLVIFDGAHNPAGVRKLVESIEQMFDWDRYVRIAITGIFSDKDIRGMAECMKGHFDCIHTVTAEKPRGMDAGKLKCIIADVCGGKVYSHRDMTVAEIINKCSCENPQGSDGEKHKNNVYRNRICNRYECSGHVCKKPVYIVFGSLSLYGSTACPEFSTWH